MAEENGPAEVKCSCSRSTLTSWWWIVCWLGTIAYYLTMVSPAQIDRAVETYGRLTVGGALIIAAVLSYLLWPVLVFIEAAEAVLLLQAIAAALGVSA